MISFTDIGFTSLYFTADEKTRLKKYCLFFNFSIPPCALVQLRWCPGLLQVPSIWILLERSQFSEILCGYFHREAENGTPFRNSLLYVALLQRLARNCTKAPNLVQWNLDLTKCHRTGEIGSLYRGSFPYITLLLGLKVSFVIPRASLYRGSLNRGSTV